MKQFIFAAFTLLALLLAGCTPAPPVPATPTAVSLPAPTPSAPAQPSGVHGDSFSPVISGDGSVIAFIARSEVPGNPPLAECPGPDGQVGRCAGVFVHQVASGQTKLASISNTGEAANGNCFDPDLSSDGRFVVFACHASNLVAEKTDQELGVFIRDLQTGVTRLVAAQASSPSVSGDGRFVAYNAVAENWQTFVHDGQTGNTVMASRGMETGRPKGDSLAPQISVDGRWVAFWSWDGNLVTEDLEGCGPSDAMYNCGDIFLYDGETAEIKRIKIGREFGLGMGSVALSLTGDGRLVAFSGQFYDRLVGLTQPLCGRGEQACNPAMLSANGRWVAFRYGEKYYQYERDTRTRTQVNLGPDGQPGDAPPLKFLAGSEGDSFEPGVDLSNNGRWMVFSSSDGNLNPDDRAVCQDGYLAAHNCLDIYLYDRQTAKLTWVSAP